MLIRDILARPAGPALAVGLALLLSAFAPPARAQQESEAVQAVLSALREPLPLASEPAELNKALEQRGVKLQQVTDAKSKLQDFRDMAQVLMLPNWAVEPLTGVPDSSGVDRKAYRDLRDRFLREMREEIKAARGPIVRAAAATFIGELAASSRSGLSGKRGNKLLNDDMGLFSKLVAELAEKDPSPEVRVAAAGALAKLQADPSRPEVQLLGQVVVEHTSTPVTVPALRTMLKATEPQVRRAAALALGDLLRGTRSADQGGFAGSPLIPVSETDLPDFGPQVARAAGAVLNGKETDAEVRRLSAAALVQVASMLKTGLRPAAPSESLHVMMRPVINALWDQTPALDRATRDDDTRVRHTAIRALEEMGEARKNWLAPTAEALPRLPEIEKPRGGSSKPPRLTSVREEQSELALTSAMAQAPAVKPTPGEPPPLSAAIPALVDRLREDNVRNRLAAIDALEMIGSLSSDRRTLAQDLGPGPAAEAVRALTRALSDPDRFVRWAAARTLGEMAPLGDLENRGGQNVERGAIGGLTRLLADGDPDVRMRVAIALGRFGKAAEDAVPALARAAINPGDLEARISATNAIQVIGGHADAAVPALAQNLGDSNDRLRRASVQALRSYGAKAVAAKDALNRALFDTDPEVRRLASDAILKIGTGR
jgi:HEAT repeat protein